MRHRSRSKAAQSAQVALRAAARLGPNVSGNVAILAALLLLPLIGLAGMAVDHMTLATAKTRLDQAADAAALAAVRTASKAIQGGTPQALAIQQGQQAGAQVFSANAGTLSNVATPIPEIQVNPPTADNVVTATVNYSTTGALSFGKIFGSSQGSVAGNAAASLSLPSYINVYLMIDTSGSTAIGASSADQQSHLTARGAINSILNATSEDAGNLFNRLDESFLKPHLLLDPEYISLTCITGAHRAWQVPNSKIQLQRQAAPTAGSDFW